MSYSYTSGANPLIDYPRLLVADTQEPYIFSDEEIQSAYAINRASAFQSSQYYSGPGGMALPTQPTNYLRCAALLLKSLAANKARLASVTQMLDVKLDPRLAAKALLDSAKEYEAMDDNSGAFAIAEQVPTIWNFYDRFWSQWQRQQGGRS